MSEKEFVIEKLLKEEKTVSSAESCTGGMVSGAFTDFAGISSVFMEGVITYANAAKIRLGVKEETISAFGAVSHETAREMAKAVRERADTDFGISTTGIAGPGGGTDKKPVGLVYVGISTPEKTKSYALRLAGDREAVRQKTVKAVFHFLKTELEEKEYGKN